MGFRACGEFGDHIITELHSSPVIKMGFFQELVSPLLHLSSLTPPPTPVPPLTWQYNTIQTTFLDFFVILSMTKHSWRNNYAVNYYNEQVSIQSCVPKPPTLYCWLKTPSYPTHCTHLYNTHCLHPGMQTFLEK